MMISNNPQILVKGGMTDLMRHEMMHLADGEEVAALKQENDFYELRELLIGLEAFESHVNVLTLHCLNPKIR